MELIFSGDPERMKGFWTGNYADLAQLRLCLFFEKLSGMAALLIT